MKKEAGACLEQMTTDYWPAPVLLPTLVENTNSNQNPLFRHFFFSVELLAENTESIKIVMFRDRIDHFVPIID